MDVGKILYPISRLSHLFTPFPSWYTVTVDFMTLTETQMFSTSFWRFTHSELKMTRNCLFIMEKGRNWEILLHFDKMYADSDWSYPSIPLILLSVSFVQCSRPITPSFSVPSFRSYCILKFSFSKSLPFTRTPHAQTGNYREAGKRPRMVACAE